LSPREGQEEDPLFHSLEVLEENCVLVKDVLFHTRKTFSRLFGIFFPSKKKKIPGACKIHA
jgi:hypothetical protein